MNNDDKKRYNNNISTWMIEVTWDPKPTNNKKKQSERFDISLLGVGALQTKQNTKRQQQNEAESKVSKHEETNNND